MRQKEWEGGGREKVKFGARMKRDKRTNIFFPFRQLVLRGITIILLLTIQFFFL